jgi:hypothetical protein
MGNYWGILGNYCNYWVQLYFGGFGDSNKKSNLQPSDQVAHKQFAVHWHPGLENMGDYYTKNHPTSHHQRVCPYYLFEPTSPLELPRAPTPEELQGCAKIPFSASRQTLSFPFQHSRIVTPAGTETDDLTQTSCCDSCNLLGYLSQPLQQPLTAAFSYLM